MDIKIYIKKSIASMNNKTIIILSFKDKFGIKKCLIQQKISKRRKFNKGERRERIERFKNIMYLIRQEKKIMNFN